MEKEQTSVNPSKDIQQIINEVFNLYTDDSYIKASMLPDLDLYVDQITTFLSQHLAKTVRSEDDKIMTKTMINNYTKNHLLPPPQKKKYSKDHTLLLIFIYYFKSFLPISDIQTILTPLTDQYFHREDDPKLEDVYTALFSKESVLLEKLLNDVNEEYRMSADIFADAPDDEKEFLREFSFICIMSLDIYMKKQIIEALIDQNTTPDK